MPETGNARSVRHPARPIARETNDSQIGQAQIHSFARLLRFRREAAGLSRHRLAQQANLSEATIKFIESARTRPTRATLLRLLLVGDLGLLPGDLPLLRHELPLHLLPVQTPPLNCYIAPDFEPLRLLEDLERTLRGAGGHLEQSSLYLTHHSALAYLRYCAKLPGRSLHAENLPLGPLAATIVQQQHGAGLTVVALGPGDGRREIRLVEHLLAAKRQALGLWLLDISQPLLTVAYQQAATTLADRPEASVLAIAGNFHRLPSYTGLFASSLHGDRQRLFVLLGTLAHLDNALRFLRDTVGSVARPGDLLLIDADLVNDVDTRSDEQVPVDEPFPPELVDWLCGPLQRALSRPERISLRRAVDSGGSVAGSIGHSTIATITTVDGRSARPRHFAILHHRRFSLASLRALLDSIGWPSLRVLPAGGPTAWQSAALLCRRAGYSSR
jgi:transcriptional regulator with XRE-family HTH domain